MKNNKGFTLIEVIIAISIMSIVIGLGYNVVNKVNSATQEQAKVSENQLNANLINTYLTKDLESCKTLDGPEESNIGQEYEFIINEGNNEIIYKVLISQKENQEIYNLTRSNNGSEIDLVTNQPKVSEKPFFISKKEGYTDLYIVELDSIKESLGKYKFEVASRLFLSADENSSVIVPGKPEEEFDSNNFHKAQFWVKNFDDSKVEMAVLHPAKLEGNKSELYLDPQNVNRNIYNCYEINIKIEPENAGNGDYMWISNGKEISGTKKFKTEKLSKTLDQIIIEISEGSELQLEVNNTFTVPNYSANEKITLKGGKYRYKLRDSKLFEVNGNIIKSTQDAYVNIYYGKSK